MRILEEVGEDFIYSGVEITAVYNFCVKHLHGYQIYIMERKEVEGILLWEGNTAAILVSKAEINWLSMKWNQSSWEIQDGLS